MRELREPFGTWVKASDLEPDRPDAEAAIRERLNSRVPKTQIPPQPQGHYAPPAPPPADMPVDPEKWRSLDRKTRRALLRHHRKVAG
jgi:hypothetical protein